MIESLRIERDVRPVLLVGLLVGLGTYSWYGIYPKYLIEIGIEPFWTGYIFTAYFALSFLMGIPAGRWADLIGRRIPMISGLSLMAISPALLSLTEGEIQSLILVALHGAGMGVFQPSSIAYIIEKSRRGKGGYTYSLYLLFWSLGMVTGSYISGLIKEASGFHPLLYIGLISDAIAAMIVLISLEERIVVHANIARITIESLSGSFGRAIEILRRGRELRLLSIAIFFHSIGYFTISAFVAPFAAYGIGLGDYEIGLILAIFNASMMLSLPLMGRLTDLWGGEIVLLLHIATSSLSWLLYSMSAYLEMAMAIMVIYGISASMDFPARRLLMARLAGVGDMATTIGALDTIAGVATLTAPTIGAYLWSNFSNSMPFLFASAINLIAVPFMLLVIGSVRHRMTG